MMKTNNIFKSLIVAVIMAIIVCCILCIQSSGWEAYDRLYRLNGKFAVISLCPIVYYIIAKHINIGNKIGFTPFFCDLIIFNIIAVLSAFAFQEKIFYHPYFSADTMSEIYMYICALTAFFVCNIMSKGIWPKKSELFLSAMLIVTTLCIWIMMSHRTSDILQSLSLPQQAVDSEGEVLNWFYHKKSMLEISLTGKLGKVHPNYIQAVSESCSLAWFRSQAKPQFIIALLALIALVNALIIIGAKKSKNPFWIFLSVVFVIRTVLGLISNMLLMFSSWVTVPFTTSWYDIILFIMCFYKTKNIRDVK